MESDEFPLTQEFISDMLGIRRTEESNAAIYLQTAGMIRYSQGNISILNRPGLEEYACECYGIVEGDAIRSRAMVETA